MMLLYIALASFPGLYHPHSPPPAGHLISCQTSIGSSLCKNLSSIDRRISSDACKSLRGDLWRWSVPAREAKFTNGASWQPNSERSIPNRESDCTACIVPLTFTGLQEAPRILGILRSAICRSSPVSALDRQALLPSYASRYVIVHMLHGRSESRKRHLKLCLHWL